MLEQESLLPEWMNIPEPVSNGLKTSELRAELVSECSASMQGREKDLAELLKTVLRGCCWREYVPAWLSRGPYGNIQEVRYESPAKAAIKHKSFREWIEKGLRLARPEKKDPVERLVLRIQSVFPEAYHAELIELVIKTAAEDGKPMTVAEKTGVARSAKQDVLSMRTDRQTEEPEQTPCNTQSRQLAELQAASETEFQSVARGEKTLNAARIAAGLISKRYAFDATTKPATLAGHIFESQSPDKIESLIRTLLVAHYQGRWPDAFLDSVIGCIDNPPVIDLGDNDED